VEVSSAGLAAVSQQQQYPVARPSQESRPAREREGAAQQPQAKPTQNEASQRTERTEQSEQSQRSVQAEQAKRQEQPKPVVNAQGQKTGTIINTTA
jgi:hypothetical protein